MLWSIYIWAQLWYHCSTISQLDPAIKSAYSYPHNWIQWLDPSVVWYHSNTIAGPYIYIFIYSYAKSTRRVSVIFNVTICNLRRTTSHTLVTQSATYFSQLRNLSKCSSSSSKMQNDHYKTLSQSIQFIIIISSDYKIPITVIPKAQV